LKTFIEDLKILYPIFIKEMIKWYFIMCIAASIMLWLANKLPLGDSVIKIYHIWITFGISFVIGFMMLYFGEYRKLLAEIRKENSLGEKYKKLYNQFIKLH
jgi:hypothetical protein